MRVFRHFRASLAAPNHVFSFDFRQNNASVKELILADNKIGEAGATAIAKMLEVGSQLILSPNLLFLSYPGLHIVSHAFRDSLACR